LTDHDKLTFGQKRVFDQELEKRIGNHGNVADRPLTADEVNQLAQQAMAVAKTAQVTNLSGKHFVQEQQFSCSVASSRNMIKAFTGNDIPEDQLRSEMRAIIGDPNRDFSIRGTLPSNAVTLLANHGIPTSSEVNVSLDRLETLSRDRPLMVGFPNHRVVLDSVTRNPNNDRTFNVRDPYGSFGGVPRKMTEANFAARYQPDARVIVPTNPLV
jgi:hypothetical protein